MSDKLTGLLDTQPYFEGPLTEAERINAERLINEEILLMENRAEHLALGKWNSKKRTYENCRIYELIDMAGEGKHIKAIDLERYQYIEQPKESIDPTSSLLVALELTESRLDNLALLEKFGPNAWLIHTHQLESYLRILETHLQSVRQQVNSLNRTRKLEQLNGGAELENLSKRWKVLVSKNIEIDIAKAMLSNDISSYA